MHSCSSHPCQLDSPFAACHNLPLYLKYKTYFAFSLQGTILNSWLTMVSNPGLHWKWNLWFVTLLRPANSLQSVQNCGWGVQMSWGREHSNLRIHLADNPAFGIVWLKPLCSVSSLHSWQSAFSLHCIWYRLWYFNSLFIYYYLFIHLHQCALWTLNCSWKSLQTESCEWELIRWQTDSKKGYDNQVIFDLEGVRTLITVGVNLFWAVLGCPVYPVDCGGC